MAGPNAWPTAADFSMMMQQPAIAFKDPDLKQVTIERDAHNLPRARSGAFANVYKGLFQRKRDPIAIRVFTSEGRERRDRYQAIDDYLKKRPPLKSLVGFAYHDKGILVNGKRYPLVTMDWVSGDTLYDWLRVKCTGSRGNDVRQMADNWLTTTKELKAARIAHGDLQHANVMVTGGGEIKLVDYDCMCVPALEGRKNLELGVEPYQHPMRDSDTELSASLDHYSELFIFVALRALAAAPTLWKTYVESRQYDKLLFCPEDFANPKASALLKDLQRSQDKEVQRLSKELCELRDAPIHEVPALDELLFSFNNVQSLLNQRDFDAAVQLLARNNKRIDDAPPALQPRLKNAEERIKRRTDLEAAVSSGDEQAMQRLYAPQLLDDYPKATPAVAIAKQAPQVIPLLAQLSAAQSTHKWRDLVKIWDSHSAILQGRKSCAQFATTANDWRSRNRAADIVLGMMQRSDIDGDQLAASWAELGRLGGHPEVTPLGARIDELVRRSKAWAAFQRIPQDLTESHDRQILDIWNERLFQGWPTAQAVRRRWESAGERVKLIAELQDLVNRPLDRTSEMKIADLSSRLPQQYDYGLKERTRQAAERIAALTELERGLATAEADDRVAAAWQTIARLRAEALVDAGSRARIADAEARCAVLQALRSIPGNYPPSQAEQYDSSLLEKWDERLLRDCRTADPWRSMHAVASRRRELLAELKAALATNDYFRMTQLSRESCLQGYPFAATTVQSLKNAAREIGAIERITEAIRQGDEKRLLEVLDTKVLRRFPHCFVDSVLQTTLQAILQGQLRKPETLKLRPPLGRKPITYDRGESLKLHVCWNWPDSRYSEKCLLAVLTRRPGLNEDPLKLKTLYTQALDSNSYVSGGGDRVLFPKSNWNGAYVVLWAEIDLGTSKTWSEPLVLGRLELAANKVSER